jgi:predicted nucleotidyltransferase
VQPSLAVPNNPSGYCGFLFVSLKLEDMRRLRKDDYLVEVTVRVAVRKQDASAVIELAESPFQKGATEENKVIVAVIDIVDSGLVKHETLLDYSRAIGGPVPTLRAFEDFRTMGEPSHRTMRHKGKPKLESPLLKKKNKGKKISLDTADRLFAGFEERLKRLPEQKEFGVAVPLVLLFGSYLRREPEVGDIDLAVMTEHLPNYELRIKQLNEARNSGVSFLDELYGPEKEVRQFLKNRSGWLALHDFYETLSMNDLSFKDVHFSEEFRPLVNRLEEKKLTGIAFLQAAVELGQQIHRRMRKELGS